MLWGGCPGVSKGHNFRNWNTAELIDAKHFFDQKLGGGGIHPLEFRTGIELQCILFYGFTDC